MEHILEFVSKLIGIEAETLEISMTVIGLGMSFITFIFFPIWALFLYKKRRFMDHVTYSFNELREEGEKTRLILRTPQVLPKGDLLPSNIVFNLKLFWAIRKCTVSDAFIKMDDQAMDILQPAIINGISLLFGPEILKDQESDKSEEEFFMAITCEKYGDIKSQKLRVMVVKEKTLHMMSELSMNDFVFERAHHLNRVQTLHEMSIIWNNIKKEKDTSRDCPTVVFSVMLPTGI